MTTLEQTSEIVGEQQIAAPIGQVAVATETQRVAVLPDLISGPLSPENSAWLGEQAQKEGIYNRRVAAEKDRKHNEKYKRAR